MPMRSTNQSKHKKVEKINEVKSSYERNNYIVKRVKKYCNLIPLIVRKTSAKFRREEMKIVEEF